MSIERIKIETPDGTMSTVMARPDSGPSRANVVLYMDAMGIRDELVGFASRFASAGYTCLLPDLYYRWGDGVGFDATKSYKELTPGVQKTFYTFVERMRDDAMVMRDASALVAQINAMEKGSALPWAAVGYCMGGRFVLRTLAAFPDLFRAGISAYGTALATDKPNSPHLEIAKVKGEFYLAFGAEDELTPPAMIEAVRKELRANNIPHEIEIFAGCGHAFMMPGKLSSYRHDASEEIWRKSFALLNRIA
jgi:carboxymethylenebutenolidase